MIKENNKDCIIKPEVEKCNHRIKSPKTSIIILDSPRTFTYPEIVFGVCKCCGKSFTFERLENGELKKIKDKGDN
jgi:hypothetical protein